MTDESLNRITALVPEVYFDLIARVTPGIIALTLVFWDSPAIRDSFVRWSAVVLLPILLVLGYGVGFVLDVFTDTVEWAVHRLLGWATDGEIWSRIDRIGDRRTASLLTKMMAEKVLMRSLLLLSLLTFLPGTEPDLTARLPWPARLVISLVLALSFLRLATHCRGRLARLGDNGVGSPSREAP